MAENASPYIDTPLKSAIRRAFDAPTIANIQAVAAAAEARGREQTKRIIALTQALKDIKENQGKVCDNYELCDHAACRSSYASWAIADAALTGAQIGE